METNKREKYLRVTEILCPFNGYGSAPAELMQKYQDRGTRVHNACNAVVKGAGAWLADSDIQGYVQAFEKWWKPEWQLLEMNRRYYDDNLEITGEVDLIFRRNGKICLADIKTSKSINKTWQYQLSAYADMFDNSQDEKFTETIDEMIVIQLFDTADFEELPYEQDLQTFTECCKLYKLFFPKKRITYENID